MDKILRYLGIVGLIFTLNSASSGFAEISSDDEKLMIKNNIVSATLENIPLGKILQQIEEQSNVWFKADKPLLNEKVSVQFKDLSLEEGLKRILISFNYSLIFDTKRNLAGLIILGKSKPGRDIVRGRIISAKKESSALKKTPVRDTSEIIPSPRSPATSSSKPVDASKIPSLPKNINKDTLGISPRLKKPISDQ